MPQSADTRWRSSPWLWGTGLCCLIVALGTHPTAAGSEPAPDAKLVSDFPPLSAMAPDAVPERVDLVIDEEHLGAHLQAAEENPRLYDGLTIGVNLPTGTHPRPDQSGQPTVAQRKVIMAQGGDAAADLDSELDRSQREVSAPPPPGGAPPVCVGNRPAPQPGRFGVFLACEGDEPVTHFHPRPDPGSADATARLAAVLAALAAGPSESEARRGYYSQLANADDLVAEVVVEGVRARIDFTERLHSLPVQGNAAGLVFLEQVVNSAFQVDGFEVLELTLMGDCLEFAYAVGGDVCAQAVRGGETNS